ncbi:MAG: NUDIX domain-containing protein [Candidatus Saccharimonadales bacterium]
MSNDSTQEKEIFYDNIIAIIDHYIDRFPSEINRLAELKKQLTNPSIDLRLRSTIPEGHFCASGILLLPENKILMLEHKALGIWVVPGGHYDLIDGDIFNTAIRETMEETGINNIHLHPWHIENSMPIDIDTHPIPARPEKNEGPHQHFDFRYVLSVDNPAKIIENLRIDTNEVLNFRAVPLDEVDKTSSIAPAVEKLKLLF